MKENETKLPPSAVIIDVRPTDFVAGGETGINIGAAPILSKDGQFDGYLPDEETQYNFRFDTFACVSFSRCNNYETIFSVKIALGLISAENIAWLKEKGYIDYRTGKVNFSDRFLAKMSKTTKSGNSLGAVGDAAREFGLVPESSWPWPAGMKDSMTDEEKWTLYYTEIPQEVKDLGLEFKARFDLSYQWILLGNSADAEKVLKAFLPYGPVQVATAVCPPWNSTDGMAPINGCGCGTQHATIIYGYRDGIAWKDFDHYRSFRKLLSWTYCIPYAMQDYVSEKPKASKPTPPSKNLVFGAPDSADVRALQAVLQALKDPATGKGYMKTGVFGPFGPATRSALARFQVVSGIPDSPQGTNYGPKTRAAMVSALAKI